MAMGCQGCLAHAAAEPSGASPWRVVGASEATRVARFDGATLRLELDTMGIAPTPLAVTGVRSAQPAPGPVDFEVTLDWNDQQNGSYLKAAIYLAPAATEGDPSALPEWLRIEYLGVPPGQRWRHEVSERREGQLRFLDRAGWPGDRGGRPAGAPRLRVRLADGRLKLSEGGAERSAVDAPGWPRTWVYLVLTGHSNYPRRTVFFRDFAMVDR